MKLTDVEFKRFKELEKKVKAKRCSDKEKQEYEELLAKKASKRDDDGAFKPGNDFAWWNKIPELTRDSATFKCNWIPGTAIAPNEINEVGVGVMAIRLSSLCGNSVSVTDPVNVWARDLYLRMFQKYRPASGYTASDLGITLLAALEAVKLIATYERIYGIINRYSKLNVNMPTTEATALGLSTSDVNYLQGHMSDFRYDLNFLIRKAQRLCIPKDMSVIADAISLFGYEYMDHDSPRSQFILFVSEEYGLYSDTKLTSGGSIQYVQNTGWFNFSADNMCIVLDTVLNALLGSDSVQRIFADLVVWFGSEAMLQFLPMPEEYMVLPTKSESILHKLHNLETFNAGNFRIMSFIDGALPSADQTTLSGEHFIYQCDDRIVTSVNAVNMPSGATGTNSAYTLHGVNGFFFVSSAAQPYAIVKGHTLDTYHNDITPDIIVEGAMWKKACTYFNPTGYYSTLIDSATFYIIRDMALYNTGGLVQSDTNVDLSVSNVGFTAGALACIDWAPLCYYLNASNIVARIFGDYDNICYVSNADLNRIHRTIVLSGLETDVRVKAN